MRGGTHPDMIRALDLLDDGDASLIVAIALRSATSEERCGCEEPILVGLDLMCGRCLRRHEGQVAKRAAWINDPHPFEPGKLGFCDRCVRLPDDPRHTT